MTASVRHTRRTGAGAGVAVSDAWSRFWFTPIPAARLGLLRIWLFGFVVVDVLLRKEVSVAMGSTPRLFWHPVGATWFLDQVGVGPPSAGAIRLVQIALATTAAAAMIGYRYRLTAPIAALLYLYWQCLGQSWGEMKHARVTLVLGLLFLATVAAAQRRSIDAIRARARRARLDTTVVDRPSPGELSVDGAWAVRAIQVGLAILYFLSGYSKLRSIGIQWAWGDTLKQALQDKASSGETTALGYWVLDHAWILVAFQVIALAWEVGFPLIFLRRFRYPVILVGLLFNIGLWITVRIEFFGVLACFAAFLPLDDWEQRLRSWWARRRDATPVRLVYDGACSRCTRDVSVALLADWRHVVAPVAAAADAVPDQPGSEVVTLGSDSTAAVTRAVVPFVPTPLATVAWAVANRALGAVEHDHDSTLP